MAHPHSHGGEAPPAASPSDENATLIGTLVHLWPYIWPGDRADLKMRVAWSMVLLLIAKLATLSVPFTFKWAIDALNGTGSAPVAPSNWTVWLIASPLLMTASYGAVRVVMAVLTQWRDGIFARVAMHAVRRLAYLTFVHMHELSLRFHLERKTGGLTRVLERGRSGRAFRSRISTASRVWRSHRDFASVSCRPVTRWACSPRSRSCGRRADRNPNHCLS